LRVLQGKGFDNGLTDSAGAACHDDDAIAKAWIRSECFSLVHGAIFWSIDV
jgi:hypothetical protein